MDVNNTAGALQSQLQAQLQAKEKSRNELQEGRNRLDLTPNVAEKLADKRADRSAPVTTGKRSNELSSRKELDAAKERVANLPAGGGTLREAPVGRISLQDEERRNIPLGQIVDIKV